MQGNLLDRIFKISQYLKDDKYDVQNQEFRRDPWTMDYLPELFVSSEKLNSQIAQLVQTIKDGNAICSITGDFKSGKSYLLNLLKDGLQESLWKYTQYEKVVVLLFSSDDFKKYSQTIYMQKIAEQVMGKYDHSKDQNLIDLKKFLENNNCLLIILLDNFQGNNLLSISHDSAKILKPLKNHFSCIIACNLRDVQNCTKGLNLGGYDHFSYSIHMPVLSLEEAKEVIRSRMCFALNQSNVQIFDLFTERAIDTAWLESQGNPWVLISILANAYSLSQKKGSKTVSNDDIVAISEMFSSSPSEDGYEDSDKFIIQQALNNFPQRERQVCEYLIHKDATAKEITVFLYGELPSAEYRSKYMGTKSFLKRLKDKNVVITKGERGRSILFGLNPKMRERLLKSSDKKVPPLSEESKIVAT